MLHYFINLSSNFCQTSINDNKVILENLVAVHQLCQIITDFLKFCFCSSSGESVKSHEFNSLILD